jgi:guanosine-3',5'-bis(diphosphate) 3'-pyrophosphohydrolase
MANIECRISDAATMEGVRLDVTDILHSIFGEIRALKSALPDILRALEFAARKHRDQRRKDADATPYINHPIQLARLLVEDGGITDAEVIIAAILHDTVEDTRTTAEELEREFGPAVARLVLEVTDDKRLPKDERKRLQVEHAGALSHGARLVKLADKICNLRDMSAAPPVNWPLERRRDYFDWAGAVVDRIRGTHAALEALFDRELARKP